MQRESRFVWFHWLPVLFLQLVYLAVSGCGMMFWIIGVLLTVFHSQGGNNAPPPAFFFVFPLLWLAFMGMWVVTIVIPSYIPSSRDAASGQSIPVWAHWFAEY